MNFSANERVDMYETYIQCNKNGRLALQEYRTRYPNRLYPSHGYFRILERNLRQTNSFLRKRRQNEENIAIVDENVELDVLTYFVAHPESSLRQV